MKILNKFLAEESHMLKTKSEVFDWLIENNTWDSKDIRYEFTDDLTVYVYGGFMLENSDINKLPVKFGTITGSFRLKNNKNLTTLKGCPHRALEDFWCINNSKLTSLEGAPLKIRAEVYLNLSFDSLHNVHKYLPEITGELYLGKFVKSSILGLLMIKGLKFVNLLDADVTTVKQQEVYHIINKYLPNTKGNSAVFDCQEELINAGHEELAKL